MEKVYKLRLLSNNRCKMSRRTCYLRPSEIERFKEIERVRPDIVGYGLSQKVHVALQEWFREQLSGLHVEKIKKEHSDQFRSAGIA